MFAKAMDKLPCVDEMMYNGDDRFIMDVTGKNENICIKNDSCSDNESSSIGKNSDLSQNSLDKSTEDDDEQEVQSSYKNPLDAIRDLVNVLPIRKGMSRFYNGKSKSFTSLAEASSSSSIKELAKPQNLVVLNKKRRNPLAYRITNGVAISKRVSNLSGTTLALAVAMNKSEHDKRHDSTAGSYAVSSSVKDFYPWRSFSLADLQQCSNPNRCDTRLT